MSKMQLTVTVSPEAGRFVEEVSAESGLKKSAVVESFIELARERRMEDLLREGYEERAQHDRELLKEFEHVDHETPWPEYAER